MGKTGNSLEYAIESILKGETKYEEIDTIYVGALTADDAIMTFDFGDHDFLEDIARDRAENELGEGASPREIRERTDVLLQYVRLEAQGLINRLYDNNKIVQTAYMVPEGQTVDVTYVHHDGHTTEEKVTGDGGTEVISINGHLYDTLSAFNLGCRAEFFDNELELIAIQLEERAEYPKDFEYLLKNMFPQHKSEIEKMFEYIRSKDENAFYVTREELLELVQTPEHTAEEIGEATTLGAEREALKAIVYEMDKEKSGPDGH